MTLYAGQVVAPRMLAWALGVRARLLLAFFGIAAFAVLAAAVGIYAFRKVGERLEVVNTRIPPAITSLELSRSAERIIAAAPALQAAPDRKRRDEVKAELEAEVGTLKTKLLELQRDRSEVSPLARIEPIVTSLTTNLGTLEERVAGRLDTNDRIKSLMRVVFQTNDATQRLLAPWLMIMEGQISKLVDAAQRSAPTGNADGNSARRLAALVEQQRPAQSAERQFSAAVDMLAEASTADQDRRLRVLAFQLGRALRDLEGTAPALDPKLRPLFLEQVAKLREFVEGPNAITEARKQELALIAEGEKRLAENAVFKAQLTAAVDELAVLASGDIRDATRDAVSVQQFSTRVLIAAVVLSLLSSALIVWLYVSRNIVRRLTALSSGMLAIAGGRLEAGPAPKGKDEIAAMGRAVEVFRRNAIELQQLLEERMKAAERLEEIVEDRTRELQEFLEYQTATSDVLNVISRSPNQLQPVLDAIVETAGRLCGAYDANLWLRQGERLKNAAHRGPIPVDFDSWPIGRGWTAGRAFVDRATVHVDDLAASDEFPDGKTMALRLGHRTIVSTPLMRKDEAIGVLAVRRTEVRPFSEKQIALLQTFADQAVIAIENVRLFDEVQARTRELSRSVGELQALGEVSHAVNSTLDLETVLSTIVAKAVQLSTTDAGAIYVFSKLRQKFRLRATYGMSEELIEAIGQQSIGLGESYIGGATERREALQVPDLADEPPSSVRDIILHAGYRGLLVVPLLRPDRIVGALVVRRKEPGVFPESTIDLLQTFAAQSVLAIQNARLFEDVGARTRELANSLEELRAAQDRLVQTEKLASLGQLTAGIAHEIKNPLNFVNNFAALSLELVEELKEIMQSASMTEQGKEQIAEVTGLLCGNLDKVVQHGKRADSIVKNMLLHSRAGSGEHRLADINAIVEESLNLAYHGARAEKQEFNIILERSLDPAAGEVDIFPQEITRVLLNLISNGFYAAMKRKGQGNGGVYEPTLLAGTRNLGDRVEIRIRDNGTGVPPEVKDKMFNPFFTTKPAGEGTGLGLSLSHDIIVKQHAGTIEVDTEPGVFTEFRIVLPRTGSPA